MRSLFGFVCLPSNGRGPLSKTGFRQDWVYLEVIAQWKVARLGNLASGLKIYSIGNATLVFSFADW